MKKKVKRCCVGTAGFLAAALLGCMPVLAAGTWSTDEEERISYKDEQGNSVWNQWIYEDGTNTWYYLDQKGYCVKGKIILGEDTYFFDENGKLLTGWITYQRDEMPEVFTGTIDGKDIYYCGTDGKMARGWIQAYKPETVEYTDQDVFREIQDDNYSEHKYYLKEDGTLCRNERKTIDGKKYAFDAEGSAIKGWIYDYGEGAGDRYAAVDVNSDDSMKSICRDHPENLMFSSEDSGVLAEKTFIDAIPAWDNDGDDSRSFYVDSSGYIVTGSGARGSGSTVVAGKKATKLKDGGRYQLADWSTDVSIVKIDGKYYCLENSGTRLDGVVYLKGEEQSGEFDDGIYGFTDGAAMQTGTAMVENKDDYDDKDGYHYYYYFAEHQNENGSKGHGITGVKNNRLYYLGLAVGAQDETYEVVYLPTLEEQDISDRGTGFFLVDQEGRVKKGARGGATYNSGDGKTYKVYKDFDCQDDYGYRIEYYDGDKDEDSKKIWRSLGDGDYDYLCWNEIEE